MLFALADDVVKRVVVPFEQDLSTEIIMRCDVSNYNLEKTRPVLDRFHDSGKLFLR